MIGGGAAGITAAREGARRGARTVLVQDGPV
ncbi:MAG: FAD-binding protein, partial [Acidimicrobiales bacterium]